MIKVLINFVFPEILYSFRINISCLLMLSLLLFLLLFRLLSICHCLLSSSNNDLCMNDVGQTFPFLKQFCYVRLLHNKNMRFLQGLLLLSHLGDQLVYLKLLNCMFFYYFIHHFYSKRLLTTFKA